MGNESRQRVKNFLRCDGQRYYAELYTEKKWHRRIPLGGPFLGLHLPETIPILYRALPTPLKALPRVHNSGSVVLKVYRDKPARPPKLLRTARHPYQHTAWRMHLMPFVYGVPGKQDWPVLPWANLRWRLQE